MGEKRQGKVEADASQGKFWFLDESLDGQHGGVIIQVYGI